MNPLKYQLYLLQIENYEIGRYWSLLFHKGFYRSCAPLRKSLVWTKKIALIAFISLIILAISSWLFVQIGLIFGIMWLIISFLFAPVYFTISLIILSPFDLIAKKIMMNKAYNLVKNSKLKIIGVAGSYGKTTLKNVISSILSQKLKVLVPPESINTAVGMSSWILKNYSKKSEILIVEFGEEYQGDNKRIAEIFPPDFAIITGINEAHFERMKSIKNIAATIFESAVYANENVKVYLNSRDKNVMKYHQDYTKDKFVEYYSGDSFKNRIFDPEKLVWKADGTGLGEIELKILGEYIFSDVEVAYKVAGELGLSGRDIKKGISEINPVDHRLEPIRGAGDVLVIDDSYNGNPEGVKEAINLLSRFTKKRKIYLTPGLVEAGEKNREVHVKIGEELADVADKVILIKNSATPYIAEGLKNKNFKDENIIWHDTAKEAHDSLSKVLKPGDVIIFQNDWGDQHL